jgi:hypothetical protein
VFAQTGYVRTDASTCPRRARGYGGRLRLRARASGREVRTRSYVGADALVSVWSYGPILVDALMSARTRSCLRGCEPARTDASVYPQVTS